jgi:hypothetical protein
MTSSGEQTVPISEVTNEGTLSNTTKSTNLGDYSSEVSVTRELSVESVLSLKKEEPCGERPQGLCFVRRPE